MAKVWRSSSEEPQKLYALYPYRSWHRPRDAGATPTTTFRRRSIYTAVGRLFRLSLDAKRSSSSTELFQRRPVQVTANCME